MIQNLQNVIRNNMFFIGNIALTAVNRFDGRIGAIAAPIVTITVGVSFLRNNEIQAAVQARRWTQILKSCLKLLTGTLLVAQGVSQLALSVRQLFWPAPHEFEKFLTCPQEHQWWKENMAQDQDTSVRCMGETEVKKYYLIDCTEKQTPVFEQLVNRQLDVKHGRIQEDVFNCLSCEGYVQALAKSTHETLQKTFRIAQTCGKQFNLSEWNFRFFTNSLIIGNFSNNYEFYENRLKLTEKWWKIIDFCNKAESSLECQCPAM